MEDLSFLHYFLCIEVAYSSRGYLLSQQKYIADLLECATLRFFYSYIIFFFHTYGASLKLRRNDGTLLLQPTRYRELVGSLIYLLLLDQIFVWLFMSSVSLFVLPHQYIMRHYFVCLVISEAPSLNHCYIVSIRLFLYELILMLNRLKIRTNAVPPQPSAFFWVYLSFFGVASIKILCLGPALRLNIVL